MSKEYYIVSAKQLLEEVSLSELYPKLKEQIQKDIHRAGVDARVNMDADPIQLFADIKQLLLDRLNTAFNEYLNLLYAIDVSESDIRNIKSEDVVDIAQVVTFLILKREWQKVCYRTMF